MKTSGWGVHYCEILREQKELVSIFVLHWVEVWALLDLDVSLSIFLSGTIPLATCLVRARVKRIIVTLFGWKACSVAILFFPSEHSVWKVCRIILLSVKQNLHCSVAVSETQAISLVALPWPPQVRWLVPTAESLEEHLKGLIQGGRNLLCLQPNWPFLGFTQKLYLGPLFCGLWSNISSLGLRGKYIFLKLGEGSNLSWTQWIWSLERGEQLTFFSKSKDDEWNALG